VFALESIGAPKAQADEKATDSASVDKKEDESSGESKSKKRNKNKSRSADKSDELKTEKEDTGKKEEEESSSKKSEEESKPVVEPKIQGDVSFQGDSRIKMILYDESDVYTITTRYGYQTNVVFSAQEEIQLISVGDRSLWQIIPSGNRMFIRPMEEDVITNMTVITNKHSYQFDLKSLPADKSGNIYVAKFVYDNNKKAGPIIDSLLPSSMIPPERSTAPSAMPTSSPFGVGPSIPSAQAVAQPSAPAQQPILTPEPTMASAAMQPMPSAAYPQASPAPSVVQSSAPALSPAVSGTNYSYTYAGPDEMAPLQVYDDGRATYLKYRDVKKLPPNVYVVDKTGKENPVSYTVKGDYMVVDVVAGELALRGSDSLSAVHVFNEMLNPG
jgi:type IV secretion system protein VirB9